LSTSWVERAMCLIFGMPFLLWRWFEPGSIPVQAGYARGRRKSRTFA